MSQVRYMRAQIVIMKQKSGICDVVDSCHFFKRNRYDILISNAPSFSSSGKRDFNQSMTLSVDSSRLATDLDHRWVGCLRDPDWHNSHTHSTMSRSY